MPLQKSLTLENGIILSEAYIKILSLKLDFINSSCQIEVGIYKDSTAYSGSKPEVVRISHFCNGNDFDTYFSISVLNGEDINPLEQGYDWLANISPYLGANSV